MAVDTIVETRVIVCGDVDVCGTVVRWDAPGRDVLCARCFLGFCNGQNSGHGRRVNVRNFSYIDICVPAKHLSMLGET